MYMLAKAINQGALAPLCGDTARISNFVCYPATLRHRQHPLAPPEGTAQASNTPNPGGR